MKVALFDFDLPRGRIALRPTSPRDAAKLLVVEGEFEDRVVRDLPGLLTPGDVLVFNDTRVIPARLEGRLPGGGAVEVMLYKPTAPARWEAFARPARKVRLGTELVFASDLHAAVVATGAGGSRTLCFNRAGASLDAALKRHGSVPLPPYIARRRAPDARDRRDYQTVFATREGAVAAPTAGLHFTKRLLRELGRRGVGQARVTLHVGAGTFLPVTAEDTEEHHLPGEWGRLDAAAAQAINRAREAGGSIVAVGTTSLRLLESAAGADGIVRPFDGETDLFITPGYRFKAADRLLTNFHLPRSTLFMLVAAFAGLARMKRAYTYAKAHSYRFYSYGDACLLRRAGE